MRGIRVAVRVTGSRTAAARESDAQSLEGTP
jgi:hypothetical protein